MRKTIIIYLFLLLGVVSNAQTGDANRITEQQLVKQDRKTYINQVNRYLRSYYEELLFNVGDLMIQESFIHNNMDKEQSRYMPEFLFQTDRHCQYLKPDQYLMELDKQFSAHDMEKLRLTIDNININPDDFFSPDVGQLLRCRRI